MITIYGKRDNMPEIDVLMSCLYPFLAGAAAMLIYRLSSLALSAKKALDEVSRILSLVSSSEIHLFKNDVKLIIKERLKDANTK